MFNEIHQTQKTLKPSLVEWKPYYDDDEMGQGKTLKPSLVEWKREG